MSIDKAILFRKLREFVLENYHESDRLLLIELIYKVIFNNPEDNCYIKGRRSDWKGLPKSKSLFTVAKGKGLPIGNLTSQIFANFYLNFFDKFVVETCGVKYYGRYVDDFVIVHEDKAFLLGLKDRLKEFIQRELAMTLHPKKVYLQHYTKGVKFIGAVINRIANTSATGPRGICMRESAVITKNSSGSRNRRRKCWSRWQPASIRIWAL